MLLALVDEVSPRVFSEDLEVLVPLCRVGGDDAHVHSSSEALELLSDAIHLFWANQPPDLQSPARRLLEALQARNLVREPFERAATGLEEAFRQL